ncbi:crotonase/enoyl-CoA hydratase family protein [Rubrimonas cliftonensis]|uniref:Methylglutaconyl-CoA hydratase n=1 Tax=Rubrimonas cliftonensis TaxID=89524 RepID=A0A1H4DVL5_9RHOB|nr:crotonase/enoyl-CoA hydratase family protein [Rubrimonas cliftonensis]SEA76420.1 methylglutaconyl-CoA hydratase [Rubrimonas cliftonensis]
MSGVAYQTVSLAVDARGVARLALARPEKRNAMSATMIAELTDAAEKLGADPGVRVVELSGTGAVFCAGGDLDWMRAQMGADRATRIASAMALARMLRALDRLPKPLIGRVQGGAYGGGVGLMAVCDAVVAAEDASFGLTEARLGLIPATIAPYVVARVGVGAARRLFVSARSFSGAEALAMGLAHRLATPDELDAAAQEEIAPCLQTAPGAAARAKALARSLAADIDDAVLADTAARLADAWEDPEAETGVAAFFSRLPPPWTVS